jgi:hypothetical protein
MPILVTCSCGAKLKATDDLAGNTVACPKCNERLTVRPPRATSGKTTENFLPAKQTASGRRQFGRQGLPLSIIAAIIAAIVFAGLLVVSLFGIGAFFIFGKHRTDEQQTVSVKEQQMDNAFQAVITKRDKETEGIDLSGSGKSKELPLLPEDMSLKAFLLQKPSGPTAVQVVCELDTYYNFEFRKCAETHYVVDPKNWTTG